jgi:predicted dehydrogenase
LTTSHVTGKRSDAVLREALDLDQPIPISREAQQVGIASIGAGAIVRACHLPVYRRAGLNLRGVYDVDQDAATALARDFGLPRVYRTLDELLADPAVLVVDVAIPAIAQPAVAHRAVQAGKHLLCQKPLAEDWQVACDLVQAAQDAHVKLAVNQQMRWAGGIRAVKALLRQELLGQPFAAAITVNVRTPWENWPWLLEKRMHEVMYHSIHYLDSLRFLLGDPAWVYAHGARFPGFPAKGETRTVIVLEYDSPADLRAVIHDEHHNQSDEQDWSATFQIEGTMGTARGTIGALYDYPRGRTDTLAFSSQRIQRGLWLQPTLSTRWFPDAFLGPMASLLSAMLEDGEPETSGTDNLLTLRLVFDAYRSMQERCAIRLAP